jgi:hypothetical protein
MTLRIEPQDLAFAIAIHLTSEVRNTTDRQRLFPAHNPPKAPASRRASNFALCPQRRPKRNRIQRGGAVRRVGRRLDQSRVRAPARVGPRVVPALAGAPPARAGGARLAAVRAHDRAGADARADAGPRG